MRSETFFLSMALVALLGGCSGAYHSTSTDPEARPCCYVPQGDYWLIYHNRAYCNFPAAIPCDEWPTGS
jgi:hypothetical protein